MTANSDKPPRRPSRAVCLNVTDQDRHRLVELIDQLRTGGVDVVDWPLETGAKADLVAITIWSGASVHDDAILARAMHADLFRRHIPILIDDAQPLIGFRQSQILTLPTFSPGFIEWLNAHLFGEGATPAPTQRSFDALWIESVAFSLLSGAVAFASFYGLMIHNPPAGLIFYGFLVPSISTYLLVCSVVRQPQVIFGRENFAVDFRSLIGFDLLSQVLTYALATSMLVFSMIADPRLLGGVDGWQLLLVMAIAYVAALVVRWIAILVLFRWRVAHGR